MALPTAHDPEDLQRIYGARFSATSNTGKRSGRCSSPTGSGSTSGPQMPCSISAAATASSSTRSAAVRNLRWISTRTHRGSSDEDVTFLLQDCSTRWPLPDASLDVVFTSNFFEHLPDKAALGRTLDEIRRCLRPGGRLVAMGPNIKYLPGAYWDFWDHYIPLTETVAQGGAGHARVRASTSASDGSCPTPWRRGPRYPVAFLRVYLRLPLVWRLFGKQFLVVGIRGP